MKVNSNTGIASSFNQIEQNKADNITKSFDKVLKEASQTKEERQDELKKACQDFEAYFLYQMFKEMDKSIMKSDLMPESQAEKIYKDMLYTEMTKTAATGRGTGIADMMYKQISSTYTEYKTKE